MTDDRYDPASWPQWVFVACAIMIGLLSSVMVATSTRPAVVAPLAVVLIVPWLVHLTGRHPSPALFLVFVYVPLLALTTVARASVGDSAVLTACIVVFVQGESVAAYRPRVAAISVAAGAVVLLQYARDIGDPVIAAGTDGLLWFGGSVSAVTVGYLLRKQQHTVVELRAAQAQLVGEAALRERQRIAREVHDVVAHSLTVTMMHVTAARMAVRRDPGSAVEALEEAETLGRQSLAEIRRTVAVLRAGEERPTDPALPGTGELRALVDGYRAAGVDLALTVDGDLAIVDAPTGLAVYRVVQEAVANAVKHAPGTPVEIRVAVAASGVRVRVVNPVPASVAARASTGGLGLVGMRERVELLDGRVTAGAHDGRWVVDVRIDAGGPEGRWCR